MDTAGTPSERAIAGRYDVVRVLGEGAAARTLLCRDTVEHRDVALKELRVEHLEDWKHLELFQREASVLGGLRHHAIPEVFDSFEAEDADGRAMLYLVQEFIDGASLSQRLEDGPALGQVELFQLALGILDVLEYLHGRSPPVYHRDIKPSNVIVRPSSAPVLVDFGSVTHGWRPTKESGSTVTGTFGYMPPEQLLGQVGPTSDLYALGATLLHVLTDRPPTDFPFDSGRIEVPADLPAPPGLRALVSALLEPAPNQRPKSVAAAREVLLMSEPSPSTALAIVDATAPAVIVGGSTPRAIDVGPPPRDPDGEFADVYRLLVDPFGARFRNRAARASLLVAMGIGTLGVLPIVYLTYLATRRRRYGELFRNGVATPGLITAMQGNEHLNTNATLVYDYVVDGKRCRSSFEFPMGKAKFVAVGDNVNVLYDPKDPGHSGLVFRHR